jgi:hypothetical protein
MFFSLYDVIPIPVLITTSLAVLLLTVLLILSYIYIYLQTHSQFPGPPVKNFWVGNLNQTMSDNVYDKASELSF